MKRLQSFSAHSNSYPKYSYLVGLLRKLKAERSELGIASNKSLALGMAYVRSCTVNTDIAEFATMTFTADFCFSSRCEKSYLYI